MDFQEKVVRQLERIETLLESVTRKGEIGRGKIASGGVTTDRGRFGDSSRYEYYYAKYIHDKRPLKAATIRRSATGFTVSAYWDGEDVAPLLDILSLLGEPGELRIDKATDKAVFYKDGNARGSKALLPGEEFIFEVQLDIYSII